MSLKELSQLYYIDKMIERDERRLEELRSNITSLSQNLSGMPKNPSIGDPVGDKVGEMVDLAAKIEKDKCHFHEEKARLEKYLRNIKDTQTRLIFILRFVDLKSWNDIAAKIGGGNTPDSVKKICYRYIKTHSDVNCPKSPADE